MAKTYIYCFYDIIILLFKSVQGVRGCFERSCFLDGPLYILKKTEICETHSAKKYESQAHSNNGKTKSMSSGFCVYLD